MEEKMKRMKLDLSTSGNQHTNRNNILKKFIKISQKNKDKKNNEKRTELQVMTRIKYWFNIKINKIIRIKNR